MEKFLSLWDDDAIFIYPGNVSASGINNGKGAVLTWFNNLLATGPSVHFSIKSICVSNIFDLIGTNVITVRSKLKISMELSLDKLVEVDQRRMWKNWLKINPSVPNASHCKCFVEVGCAVSTMKIPTCWHFGAHGAPYHDIDFP